MIGLRTGLALGLRLGPAVGITADSITIPNTASTTQTVTVADSADPVITGGDAFAYTVQYTNTGAATANAVSVVITLDASLAYVSSSGSGWSIGVSGQVVTCTRATAAVGAAPAITINVTTGTSAVSASTTAQATASNAGTANGSQGTTVQFVSKDATKGWYFPATNTEYTNLLTRKGSTATSPGSLYGMQDASGGAVDANAVQNLAQGGTPTYAQTVSGLTRKGIVFVDNSAQRLVMASGTGPSPATTSQAWFGIINFPAAPAGQRIVMGLNSASGSTSFRVLWNTNGTMTLTVVGVSATGASSYASGLHAFLIVYDRTNSRAILYTELEKIVGTYSASVIDGDKGFGANNLAANVANVFGGEWQGTPAVNLDDNAVRSLFQAHGITVAW